MRDSRAPLGCTPEGSPLSGLDANELAFGESLFARLLGCQNSSRIRLEVPITIDAYLSSKDRQHDASGSFFYRMATNPYRSFVALCFHLSHEDEKHQSLRSDMGRFHLHLHGRIKDSALKSLAETYEARMKNTGITVHVHTDELGKYISKLEAMSGQLFLLDEKGSMFSSVDFAEKIRAWSLLPTDTHFAIGPPDGWDDRGQNLPRISLSHMTFPHEFAAVLMLEQLYRSQQIIKGTSYHNA